jgi:urease accessory protein
LKILEKSMYKKPLNALLLIAMLSMCMPASAHLSTEHLANGTLGLADGLLHPFTGLDHLAAMLAVGLWSALTARRVWTAPLAFAAMLVAGALMGVAGISSPAVEPMVAASLLALGLLVAARTRLPAALATGLVGGFAVFHGLAHGAELAGGGMWFAPLAGMLISTLALHLVGMAAGYRLRTSHAWWPRVAGTALAVLGGALLLQMV